MISRWGRAARRGVAAGALAAALWLLLGARPPHLVLLVVRSPRAAAPRLAHFLADFSAHARVAGAVGAWRVLAERGNGTTWRYEVRYECGRRCGGRAHVAAHDELAPRLRRVLLQDERCWSPPLLPGLSFCEDVDLESVIEVGGEEGAEVRQRARWRCGVWGAARGGCAARAAGYHGALRAALEELAGPSLPPIL